MRDATADLLKGTAVVLMIQIHLMELFALPDVCDSWVGKVSLFLGGPPAAPLFLLVMGYYTAASTRSMGGLLLRGIKLFGAGRAAEPGPQRPRAREDRAGRPAAGPLETRLGCRHLVRGRGEHHAVGPAPAAVRSARCLRLSPRLCSWFCFRPG